MEEKLKMTLVKTVESENYLEPKERQIEENHRHLERLSKGKLGS